MLEGMRVCHASSGRLEEDRGGRKGGKLVPMLETSWLKMRKALHLW